MQIKSTYSTQQDTSRAFQDVSQQIPENAKLILFFVSTNYDFQLLSTLFHTHFPRTEVIGVSTTGEITKDGFKEFSLSVQVYTGDDIKAKGVLMSDIEKYPIFFRDELKDALKEVGIDENLNRNRQDSLGLIFPNGLIAAEEKMLSIVNSIFSYDGFPLFGGTAGDNAKFVQTFVSVNGDVSSTGGAVVFLKSRNDFYMHKENIFQSTGKKMKITKASSNERIVHEMNGRKASTEYARLLGVKEKELASYFMTNPLGRTINEEIWIASPFQILPDGSIQFYCQIYQDSTVDILEPKSAQATLKQSVDHVKSQFSHLEGVLAINCILRKLQFENQRIIEPLSNELKRLPNLAGFSSYGEQLGKNQLNQTLVLLGFGKK